MGYLDVGNDFICLFVFNIFKFESNWIFNTPFNIFFDLNFLPASPPAPQTNSSLSILGIF